MQLRWMADADPVKMKAFEEMPMIEYLMLLNKHIQESIDQAARMKRASRS